MYLYMGSGIASPPSLDENSNHSATFFCTTTISLEARHEIIARRIIGVVRAESVRKIPIKKKIQSTAAPRG